MYGYEAPSNPLGCELLSFIDDVPDDIPTVHPFVPRLCKEKGHMLIWHGTEETDPDIAKDCFRNKTEPQWITCREDWKVEKAVVLVWPYEDEVILGAVKYPGYMKRRSSSEIRKMMKLVWKDVISMFGSRKIICPSGTYLNCLHMYMNQMTISHGPYHHQIMERNGFKRANIDYWVREASNATTKTD
jgi:hypothetical protein